MTAIDVIHQIEELPPTEMAKVINYVQELRAHMPNAETIAAFNEPLEGLPRFDSIEALRADLEDDEE